MAFRNPGRTPASQPPGGDYWSQFEPEAEPPAAPPVTLPPNFGTAAGTAIGDTLRGTPAGTPAKPGAPTFRAGMTPEEVKAAVTQDHASRGVTPLPTSVDYWVQKVLLAGVQGRHQVPGRAPRERGRIYRRRRSGWWRLCRAGVWRLLADGHGAVSSAQPDR